MIAFTWFYLIKVKTLLCFLFYPSVFLQLLCVCVGPVTLGQISSDSSLNKREYLCKYKSRTAQIKSPSFLHPGSNLPEQTLTHQIAPLWFKRFMPKQLLSWNGKCWVFLKKYAWIREMAKDFLQLFAQEMSAFSDVTLSGLWWAQDLNSPFCN